MGKINLNYSGLFDNYSLVTRNIDELLNVIDKINSECKSLSGCWEGSLADAFSGFSTNFDSFSNQTILNFRNTEEYKNYAIKSFKLNEEENLSKYNV